MFSALSKIFGFDRPAPAPLTPKARRTAPSSATQRAKAVSDKPPVVSDTRAPLSDELAQAREDQRLREQKRTIALNGAQAVVVTSKVYGDFSGLRAWFRGSNEEMDAAALAFLGAELHSYCRALFLAGSKTPHVDRRYEFDEAHIKRLLTNLQTDCLADVDTWERALNRLEEIRRQQRRAGRPETPPLTIPEAVLVAIAQRQAARAERLDRQANGGGRGGKGGPVASAPVDPDQAADEARSSLKGGGRRRKKPDDDEGGGGPPAPPPGPRR